MTPVAQDLVAYFADPRHVDQHASCRGLARNPRAAGIELDDVAVFREQHLYGLLGAAHHAPGDARMLRELAILAVDRDEVARPDERDYQLQLFNAAVPRHMDVLHIVGYDVRAQAGD